MPRVRIPHPPRLCRRALDGRAGTDACAAGRPIICVNVLRCKAGDAVLLFNGRDGEWRAVLGRAGKTRDGARSASGCARSQRPAICISCSRRSSTRGSIIMVQKAVELGASRLQPVITRHTQVGRVNLERMRANAIEAAQQCGVLALPEVAAPRRFCQAVQRPTPTACWCSATRMPTCRIRSARAAPASALAGERRWPC